MVLISGATGLIGKYLVKTLVDRGDNVIVLTQNISSAKKVFPQLKNFTSWHDYMSLYSEKISCIINLAGTNLDAKRWDEKFKRDIYDSRILSTRRIAYLISKMSSKPEVLVNASGVDYYGDTGDKDIDESAPYQNTFISKLVRDWEWEALSAEKFGVRVVCLRTGFVIARDSKPLRKMSLPYKLFIGGHPGNGKQYFSWIDIEDLVNIYLFCLENKSISGAVNATSPNPVTMKEFSEYLGKALHRLSYFPVPSFILKLLFGEKADLILTGRKALPKKLLDSGFHFKYNSCRDALHASLN